MNIEDFRDYCLAKPGSSESFPFDKNTLVFKVMGKMFALVDVETYAYINVKCDPERAIRLREEHMAVRPGYHMNKKHWNSVHMDGTIGDRLVRELVDHSYDQVVKGLSKAVRAELDLMRGE